MTNENGKVNGTHDGDIIQEYSDIGKWNSSFDNNKYY